MNSEKIIIVIVLYKTLIKDSKTINSICNIKNFNKNINIDFIIYDNNELSQSILTNLPFNAIYKHDKSNGGLASAYNFALDYCNKNQYNWLLLLDQDTELTNDYFNEIENCIKEVTTNDDIVCVVPKIYSNKKIISPVVFLPGGFIKQLKKDIKGTIFGKITGINSPTLLKVDFINSIGSFNNIFKLDMLDYWYFSMIYKAKKLVYVLDCNISHNLSVMDYSNVSIERYKNIIAAELTFFSNYCSIIDLILFKFRLVLRFVKQYIKLENKKFSILTLKTIFS